MAARQSADAAEARASVGSTFRESPAAVKALLAGVFINRLGGFLTIFLVLYLTSLGYSVARASLGLGAYGLGAVVGVLIGGALVDRLGARNTTVVSMSGAAVLTASLLYLHDYPLLLAVAALAGLSGQMFRPASATLLSELTPEDRQVMVFAMYRFGLNLGATAAPLVGFALYDLGRQSYALLFWGEAAVALAFALLSWRALPARASRPAVAAAPSEPDVNRHGYLAVLRDRRFVLYLVAALVHTAVYAQYLSTLPLDVAHSGLRIVWYTVAVSLNGLVVIVFELLVTKVTQTWPFKLSIGLAFALLGLGVACYGLPIGPAVIIAGTLIWSLGEIIGGPSIFAYPAIVAPAQLKSRYLGSFQFVFGLGSALGPMIGGWLFVQLGHGVWPVLACGSAVATALVLCAVRTPAVAAEAEEDPAEVTAPAAAAA
ncbi:MFS transporter [Streptacidiphilus sp. N1-12]|uniref:MFS transporter n=2 Tax=Streptacidiphilus alkalitolerans TaxID=3342712 RepID=A0ABV6WKU3_9ACTN